MKEKRRSLAEACSYYGFNLESFDTWLASLPEDEFTKTAATGYRGFADHAVKDGDNRLLQVTVELMNIVQIYHDQIDFLLPAANRDKGLQDSKTKKRRPEINEWIRVAISRCPDATRDELWSESPEWLSDEISIHRFRKRVSEVRKEK